MAVNVILTALPPTKGHEDLVRFASGFAERVEQELCVLIFSGEGEPLAGHFRQVAFHRLFQRYNTSVSYFEHDLPDNPRSENDTLFWDNWTKLIRESGSFSSRNTNYLIASEPYGVKLASMLDATFIPYDMHRETRAVSATMIREDPLGNFHHIMSTAQHLFRKRVVLFGAESTGKTTMAKRLAKELNGVFIPEWARGYLETVGPELNQKKMDNILYAQFAIEQGSADLAMKEDKPFIFCDTDIMSTYGYMDLKGYESPLHLRYYLSYPHLYLVMNSGIPFEPDQLRYGVDKREATDKYWLDVLMHQYGSSQYAERVFYMPAGSHEEQFQVAKKMVIDRFMDNNLWGYKRK